jgi:hypothetical protein
MELVQVARDNDRLNERMHQLILDLIKAGSLEQVIDTLNDHLRGEFKADTLSLLLYDMAPESGTRVRHPAHRPRRRGAGTFRELPQVRPPPVRAPEAGAAGVPVRRPGPGGGVRRPGAHRPRCPPGHARHRQQRGQPLSSRHGHPVPEPPRRADQRRARTPPAAGVRLKDRMDPEAHDWVARFLGHLDHERRYSHHTLRNYRRDLEQVMAYCGRQGIARWSDLDSHQVRALAAEGFRQGLAGPACSAGSRPCAACTVFSSAKAWRAPTPPPTSAPRKARAPCPTPWTWTAWASCSMARPTTHWRCATWPCSSCSIPRACAWRNWCPWTCTTSTARPAT